MIHRIRERRDFERLNREGVRASGRYVWVRFVGDEACVPPRVAYAIGRQHGSAVRRNRIRRRLRACFQQLDAMSTNDGSDGAGTAVAPGLYLVGWRGRSDEPPFDALTADVDKVARRLSNTN